MLLFIPLESRSQTQLALIDVIDHFELSMHSLTQFSFKSCLTQLRVVSHVHALAVFYVTSNMVHVTETDSSIASARASCNFQKHSQRSSGPELKCSRAFPSGTI